MTLRTVVLIAALGLGLLASRPSAQQPVRRSSPHQAGVPTEAAFVRLQPSAALGLPDGIVRYLLRRGYTIPHVIGTQPAHNVVRGQFAKPWQRDIAVLASDGRQSRILIFWGGSVAAPTSLARRPDDSIRAISRADPKYIKQHHESYGGPQPPSPLNHDGIDDGMMEKGSIVWYRHRGQWLQLTGAN